MEKLVYATIAADQQSLTADQETCARQFAAEHTAKMLSTTPANKREVEDQVRKAYEIVDLRPPQRIRWFDSPHTLTKARVEVNTRALLVCSIAFDLLIGLIVIVEFGIALGYLFNIAAGIIAGIALAAAVGIAISIAVVTRKRRVGIEEGIQEAWTFGVKAEEYKPRVET